MELDEPTAAPTTKGSVPGGAARQSFGIAICLSHFHPTIGGAERQMLQLARVWRSAGHPVHVFTRSIRGEPRRETVEGIDVCRSIRALPWGPLFGITYLVSLVWALWRRRRAYEVVLAAQASWEAVGAALAARLTGAPLVIRAASAGPSGELAQLAAANGSWLWLRLLRSAQRFLASSSDSFQQFLEVGCPANRVSLVGNGVDLSLFFPARRGPTEIPTAIFVGRLVAVKRLRILLEAWRRAAGEEDFRLLIAGDGPERDELLGLAHELRLDNVEFLGQQSDIAGWYRKADVFVLPSAIEGSSNALLEAMASGLCPVVTRVGGNVDVIQDGVNGLSVEPDDADDLAAALKRVLHDGDLRRRLAAAARQRVESKHDLARVANWYLTLFDELTSAGRPNSRIRER